MTGIDHAKPRTIGIIRHTLSNRQAIVRLSSSSHQELVKQLSSYRQAIARQARGAYSVIKVFGRVVQRTATTIKGDKRVDELQAAREVCAFLYAVAAAAAVNDYVKAGGVASDQSLTASWSTVPSSSPDAYTMSPQIEDVGDIFVKHPSIKQDVEILKHWLVKQKHLPSITDRQLVTFLNSCDNSLEAAKKCIDAYFTVKCGSPEFFRARDPLGDDIKHISKLVQIVPLSKKSEDGCTYIFARLIDTDVANYYPDYATKMLFMVIDAALRYDALAPGVVLIYDMAGAQFQHVAKTSPTSLKKYMKYVQEAMPVKLRAMHVINSSPLITKILMFIRPFMNQQHLQLLNFHTADAMDEFYKAVPKKRMPQEYGGADESLEVLSARTSELLAGYRGWFKEEEAHCKVDESQRATKLANVDGDLFGHNGSFKKLTLD